MAMWWPGWYRPWWYWSPWYAPELELAMLESYKKLLEAQLKMIEERINTLRSQMESQ